MDISTWTLEQCQARLKEIRSMNIDSLTGEEVEEISKEVEEIEKRKAVLANEVKMKKELRSKIANREVAVTELPKPEETRSAEVEVDDILSSKEYRSAFLKQVRKMPLTQAETRTLTSAAGSVGSAVPTQTLNKIIEKVKQYAPMLEKIDLLSVNGYVTVPAEGTTVDAQLHAEGAKISGDDDKIEKITLGMYEITKLVTISKTVEKMSIDAFENYLVKKISRKVAEKITRYILNGTGSGEPQGINAITWNESNSVTIAKAASLTEKDLDKLVSLLNGGYDNGAEWYMSKKTFFTEFRPLQDKSKNDVIVKENGTWFVEGFPVNFDDDIKFQEAILGNLPVGYIGNMPEAAHVTSQFVVRENSFDFLGSAMFDGKVSAVEAFVKLVKGTV